MQEDNSYEAKGHYMREKMNGTRIDSESPAKYQQHGFPSGAISKSLFGPKVPETKTSFNNL